MQIGRIRNIGIAAAFDAGKATLAQRMLYLSSVAENGGENSNLKAALEFVKKEQEKGVTIASSAVSLLWNDHLINIIDTPGHLDFVAEVERAFRAMDGLLLLFCAVKGVEPLTETAWRLAEKFKIPKIACINRIDKDGADFKDVLLGIEEQLGTSALPFHLPMGEGSEFKGIVDLAAMKAIIFEEGKQTVAEIPFQFLPAAKNARRYLIEQLAEFDEDIFESSLAEEDIPEEEIWRAARECALNRLITPLFCASAYHLKGVAQLLNAIIGLLPSPVNRGAINCFDAKPPNAPKSFKPQKDEPLCALTLKVIEQPAIGRQTFVRIFSGSVSRGNAVYIPRTRSSEKVKEIFRITATERLPIESAGPGEVVALIGPSRAVSGDTLSDAEQPTIFEIIKQPIPIVRTILNPPPSKDPEPLFKLLAEMREEDISLVIFKKHNRSAIISGANKLQLQTVIERIKSEYSPEIEAEKISACLYASPTKEVTKEVSEQILEEGEERRVGLKIRFEPIAEDSILFESRLKRTDVRSESIYAVREGIEEGALTAGPDGFPAAGFKALLLDLSAHGEMADTTSVKTLATRCLSLALIESELQFKEPFVELDIATPDDYITPITAAITKRRGFLTSMRRYRKGSQKLIGRAPVAELLEFEEELHKISNGTAILALELDRFEPIASPH
ncbi:MAG: elongation factor G [Myxococcota bacterium]